MKKPLYLIFIATIFLNACNDTVITEEIHNQADILSSHIDSTIIPGDDFFGYANGAWIKRNPIPSTETGWGIFNLVEEENYLRLRKIAEEGSATLSKEGSTFQQIGDFFYSGMDSIHIEAEGIKPLTALLNTIDSVSSKEAVLKIIAMLQKNGVPVFFNWYVDQDLKNSEKNVVYISQGGLGLPDRDYYFNTDGRSKTIRDEYLKHIKNMLIFLNIDSNNVSQKAKNIFQLETTLASSHKKLEDLRDPYTNYFKMDTKSVSEKYPNVKCLSILESMGIKTDTIIVTQLEYFAKLNSIIHSISFVDLKDYFKWHLIRNYASFLDSKIDKEHFHFYSNIMRGMKEQRLRWKRVLDNEEFALGDALGQVFVKEYFSEKTKKRYEDLVEKIIESYRERIRKLDWMGDSTKQKALVKLNAMNKKVGYPNQWKDYSTMKISKSNYCNNMMEANRWHVQYSISKLGKPVDRNEWSMTPQTYNAYYNPSNNEIVLPAAIFTCPNYKDNEIDDAVIYGYVGASTIGHELTHGFDDEGRKYDEHGNLKNWWTKSDEENFEKRAHILVQQFNQYTVLDSLHPNGKATLGENIADLGGVIIGLDAFKKTKQFQEGKRIAGLTPLQRYFLGYAYGWMQTRTPEMFATQLLTDVHAPIFLRVIAPMSNCDDWYHAFSVRPQNKYYRDSISRVRIW